MVRNSNTAPPVSLEKLNMKWRYRCALITVPFLLQHHRWSSIEVPAARAFRCIFLSERMSLQSLFTVSFQYSRLGYHSTAPRFLYEHTKASVTAKKWAISVSGFFLNSIAKTQENPLCTPWWIWLKLKPAYKGFAPNAVNRFEMLSKYNIYQKLLIDGTKSKGFSAQNARKFLCLHLKNLHFKQKINFIWNCFINVLNLNSWLINLKILIMKRTLCFFLLKGTTWIFISIFPSGTHDCSFRACVTYPAWSLVGFFCSVLFYNSSFWFNRTGRDALNLFLIILWKDTY